MGFTKLKVHHKLIDGLKLMGITVPTPIQEKCIPSIKDGKDVVGQSLTGSGKTAAFGLPILEKIVPGAGLQALILTPTRELCLQDRDSLELMGRFLPINIISIYGGVGYFDQTEGLKIAEIVVATPGRLLDHMGRRNTNFKQIKYVVLDEADKMFEMGFEEDVSKILGQTPQNRQTILFSATMPKAAQSIVRKYLKNPVYIQEKLHVDKSLLKQVYYNIRRDDKFSLLTHLLKHKAPGPAIVFCGTKREVDRVARNLRKQKIDAMPVHGDLSQSRRQQAVELFKKAKIDVLVATDVASRGLDIKDVTHVYNYDVPRVPEDYTHRIGRTARAGKKGDAVTLLSERDYNNFDKILRQKKFEILEETVPHFERIEIQRQSYGEREDNYPRHQGGQRNDRRGPRHGDWNRGEKKHYQSRDSYGEQAPQQRQHYGRRDNYQREAPRQEQRPRHFERREIHHEQVAPQRHSHSEDFSPKIERTPRTPEPLFPTSHYNPNYQKNKPQSSDFVQPRAQNYSHPQKKSHQSDSYAQGGSGSSKHKSHYAGDAPFYKKNKKNFSKHRKF